MTAVESLIEKIQPLIDKSKISDTMLHSLVEEHLEMEKKQIIDSFEIGYDNGACVQEGSSIYHGGNYYNETFKKD